MKHFTIAIDGPGGAGKSSVANNVAKQLGVLHLDTGAMYRAFAYQALKEGLDTRNAEALEELTRRVQIDVRFVEGVQHTYVNGEDVTGGIRTPQISMATSDCAVNCSVRALMVAMQQKIAQAQSMVLDGRDTGTKVLPDATLKIFLTASSEVRARRRYEELIAGGIAADFDTVLEEVELRDRQDSTRKIDPLCVAPEAIKLDSSHMTQAQVEKAILTLLENKLMQETKAQQELPREKLTWIYRFAMGLSRLVFSVLMPVRYHGMAYTRVAPPFILIGNHNSMLDPLLIGWKLRHVHIRFFGKRELTKNPLMRAIYQRLLMIPVDRHNMDMHAVRDCLKTLKEGHALGIFPEGTRHKQTLMEEMESGVAMIALRGNVPIIPAYLTGKPRFFRTIDCYYGEPISVAEIAAKGINKDTCEELLVKIKEIYRDMAQKHAVSKTN